MTILIRFLVLLAFATAAQAQNWPAKPVRVIVPTGPGLAPDIIGRLLVDKLSRQIGQQFYVENVAGAATIVGSQMAARAAPDGYTLLMATADGNTPNNPGIPLVSETIPGFVVTGFLILMAPAGTPGPILQRLNQETQTALRETEFANRLITFGFATSKLGSLQATNDGLNVERERWGRMVRELGITPQ